MDFLHEIKYRLRKMMLPIVFMFFTVAALFSLCCGDRGFHKYLYLKKEVEYARNIASQYHTRKELLNKEVQMLSPSSLDLDMLDERARTVLNMVSEGEFVILDDSE